MYNQNSAETWCREESIPVLQYLSQGPCIFFGLCLSSYTAPFLPPSNVADGLGWRRWPSTTCCKFFCLFCYITPFVVAVCKGWLEIGGKKEESVKWCWYRSVLSCFPLCHCWEPRAGACWNPASKGSRFGTLISVMEKGYLFIIS